MITIIVSRQGNVLVPASEWDRAELGRLPNRQAFKIHLDMAARTGVDRLYRALIDKVAKGIGRPREAVDNEVMTRLGYVEAMYVDTTADPDESIVRMDRVSRLDWGQPEWTSFYEHALPFVIEKYLGDIPAGPIRREIERMTGISEREVSL